SECYTPWVARWPRNVARRALHLPNLVRPSDGFGKRKAPRRSRDDPAAIDERTTARSPWLFGLNHDLDLFGGTLLGRSHEIFLGRKGNFAFLADRRKVTAIGLKLAGIL